MNVSTLTGNIRIIEQISQDRKVQIDIHIAPHGNFITVTLPNGASHAYDYGLEIKMNKELGLHPTTREFINDLVNQTIDNN